MKTIRRGPQPPTATTDAAKHKVMLDTLTALARVYCTDERGLLNTNGQPLNDQVIGALREVGALERIEWINEQGQLDAQAWALPGSGPTA